MARGLALFLMVGLVAGCDSGGENVPDTLASGLAEPVAAVLLQDNLVWLNRGDGTVMSMPLPQGGVTTLASGQDHPSDIQTDGTALYWVNTGQELAARPMGSVMRMVPGRAAVALAGSQDKPRFLAVGGGRVFWCEAGGNLMVVASDGSQGASVLQRGPCQGAVALDGDDLYWVEADTAYVLRTYLPSLAVDHVVQDFQRTRAMRISNGLLFYATDDSVRLRPLPEGEGGTLMDAMGVHVLAVAGQTLLWAKPGTRVHTAVEDRRNSDGVLWMRASGSTKAVQVAGSVTNPSSILVHQGKVYWLDAAEGTIHRALKDVGVTP